MLGVSDFSGLVSSACALASAAAIAPIVSLDRCMARLHVEKIEADRARLGAFGANAVSRGFLGVLGHQPFQLRLGALVFEEGGAGRSEQAGELQLRNWIRSCRRFSPPRFEAVGVRRRTVAEVRRI